ncbi:MAG: hypothetical protein AAF063_08475 [Cyanobacteria bacterium J06643_5]
MHSQIKCLMTVALTCTVFAASATTAKAQSSVNHEFEITYDTLFTLIPIEEQPGFFTANISGTSQGNSIPFGLSNFESNTFGKLVSEQTVTLDSGEIVPVSRDFQFNANPDILGLVNPPQSVINQRAALGIPNPEENSDIYFGDSKNKLFGQADDMATINFFPPGSPDFPGTVNGGGVITITGGTGVFENASGEITFEQSDRLPLDQNAPAPGVATLKFKVQKPQAVPESTDVFGLSIGMLGAGYMLRRNRRQ